MGVDRSYTQQQELGGCHVADKMNVRSLECRIMEGVSQKRSFLRQVGVGPARWAASQHSGADPVCLLVSARAAAWPGHGGGPERAPSLAENDQ